MGFDVKDIVDILPFILDNLSVCAYIIIINAVFGFFLGRLFEKVMQKKKIADSELRLERENEQSGKSLDDSNRECVMLRNRGKCKSKGLINLNFASLSELERMLDSAEGKVELTALIELNYKRDQEVKNDQE